MESFPEEVTRGLRRSAQIRTVKPACEHIFLEKPFIQNICIKCGIPYKDAGTEKETL